MYRVYKCLIPKGRTECVAGERTRDMEMEDDDTHVNESLHVFLNQMEPKIVAEYWEQLARVLW